jgi:hypothetical protein
VIHVRGGFENREFTGWRGLRWGVAAKLTGFAVPKLGDMCVAWTGKFGVTEKMVFH